VELFHSEIHYRVEPYAVYCFNEDVAKQQSRNKTSSETEKNDSNWEAKSTRRFRVDFSLPGHGFPTCLKRRQLDFLLDLEIVIDDIIYVYKASKNANKSLKQYL